MTQEEWERWADGRAEKALRAQVALMRELGVVQAFGIVLGPEPRAPAKEMPQMTAEERRTERINAARDELRARLGMWDLPAEKCDALLDPAIFSE